MNKAIVIGNLGQDPEVRFSQNGTAIANISVATNETWMKDGEKQERTEWHRITVFGKQAESCGEFLKKGSQVCVEGRIQTRQWEDKEGNTRYTTEIVADRVQFLSGGNRGGSGGASQSSGGDQESFNDSEIPF